MNSFARIIVIGSLLTCASGALARQSPQGQSSSSQPAAIGNHGQQVPKELMTNGTVRRAAPKPGEFCTVCDQPVKSRDLVYLVDGQRVPVHAGDCDTALRSHPQRWLARLTPRGGAFLGTDGYRGVNNTWLYIGLYVLAGLVFAALSAQHALRGGYNPLTALLLGLTLNVLGYLFVITRPRLEVKAPAGVPAGLHKIPTTYDPQPCPGCGSENHPSATRCLSCGSALSPQIASEVEKAGLHT